ncbi:hypothetical protein BGX27_005154, partial [Mortierella sp. AM989]
TYGRNRMIDCHHEQAGARKDEPRQTSIPSTTGDDYFDGIRPVTLVQKDGQCL